MRSALLTLLVPMASTGCYLEHAPPGVPSTSCDEAAPICVRRDDVCGPLARTEAICLEARWHCAEDSWVYAEPWLDDVCLPLADRHELFSDGVHEAPVAMPIDGICSWVLPAAGGGLAFAPVPDRCDALADPLPLATVGDGFDYLAVQAAVTARGEPLALVRGWTFDAAVPFGVRSDGVGLAQIVGHTLVLERGWLFGPELDLGDGGLVDGAFVYAFGCPGDPRWLEEDCILGRAPIESARDASSWSTLSGGVFAGGEPDRIFGAGPHRSALVRDPRGSGFLHVYAVGFGTTLELTSAPRPEGPWTPPRVLATCELPADDESAYCAGPTIHLELYDPLRPDDIVVGYSVGTTAPDGAERRARAPSAYWPRLVRLTL